MDTFTLGKMESLSSPQGKHQVTSFCSSDSPDSIRNLDLRKNQTEQPIKKYKAPGAQANMAMYGYVNRKQREAEEEARKAVYADNLRKTFVAK
jgi:hypothetical protein